MLGEHTKILHGMMQVSWGWTVMTDYSISPIDTNRPRAHPHYHGFQCIE